MKIPKELIFVWSKIEDKRMVYKGMTMTLLMGGIIAVIPYIYGRLVDFALKPGYPVKFIVAAILLWTILSLLNDWMNRENEKMSDNLAVGLFSQLHIDAFKTLINLPMQFHKDKKLGEVMAKIDRTIEGIYNIVYITAFSFIPTIITFFIAMTILLFVEWHLSIILIFASVLYIWTNLVYASEAIKTQEKLNKVWSKAFGKRHDSLSNINMVKAMANENVEYKRTGNNFKRASILNKAANLIWFKVNKWQNTIFTISFITVFSIGIFMLRSNILTPGKLIMFVGYIGLLTAPLAKIADQYRRLRRVLVSIRDMMKYFEMEPEKDLAQAVEIKNIKGDVIFENVNFGYKKESDVLKNISFDVLAGQTVALVGESGVGKTSLVDLIGKYYFPSKGKILIDGIDIKKITLKSLRKNMAVVPQEVLLFHDTIKNNISYGRLDATAKEIIEAAKAANAHEFIESFPKKYEQLVGERGIKLSTGQKQRIAIARAILRNPKILILDEATSALDSHSEKLVQEALRHLIKGRTTFVIAHRLSTIQHADKIIVLEKGKIVEMGKHENLMKNPKGIYRNFWELQSAIQRLR